MLDLTMYNMFHGKIPSALDLLRPETTSAGFHEKNSYLSKSEYGPIN